jgi:tetratricopeptide (TPR) repeat protein
MFESGSLAELAPFAEKAVHDRPNSLIDGVMKCWLDARLGRRFEATLFLERLAAEDFAELRHCADFLAGAAAVADVCIQLGNVQHHARRIYEMLLPYHKLQIALGQICGQGAVAYHLGRLAKTLSKTEDALRYFKSAVELHLQAGNPSWTFYAAFDLANALRDSGQKPENQKALTALLELIRSEAAKHGMTGLSVFRPKLSSDVMKSSKPGLLVSNIVKINGAVPAPENGHSMTGQSKQFLDSGKTRPIFKREANLWHLSFGEQAIKIRHCKGLALISELLQKPGEPLHVRELDTMIRAPQADPQLHPLAPAGNTGPLLDSAAKHSYRERARDLREELEEALRFNDRGRAEKIEQELQALTRELARSVDLFGRDRSSGSADERARLRVTNAIKYAVSGIKTHHEPLAGHLNKTIKTGFYCAYRPDFRIDWEL